VQRHRQISLGRGSLSGAIFRDLHRLDHAVLRVRCPFVVGNYAEQDVLARFEVHHRGHSPTGDGHAGAALPGDPLGRVTLFHRGGQILHAAALFKPDQLGVMQLLALVFQLDPSQSGFNFGRAFEAVLAGGECDLLYFRCAAAAGGQGQCQR
jgi:hypothetical protein